MLVGQAQMTGNPVNSTNGERFELGHDRLTPCLVSHPNGPRRYFPARQTKDVGVTTCAKLGFDLYFLTKHK